MSTPLCTGRPQGTLGTHMVTRQTTLQLKIQQAITHMKGFRITLTSLALFLVRCLPLFAGWEWWFSCNPREGSSDRDGEMDGDEKGGDISSKPASLQDGKNNDCLSLLSI